MCEQRTVVRRLVLCQSNLQQIPSIDHQRRPARHNLEARLPGQGDLHQSWRNTDPSTCHNKFFARPLEVSSRHNRHTCSIVRTNTVRVQDKQGRKRRIEMRQSWFHLHVVVVVRSLCGLRGRGGKSINNIFKRVGLTRASQGRILLVKFTRRNFVPIADCLQRFLRRLEFRGQGADGGN